jgi:hypothetical protein
VFLLPFLLFFFAFFLLFDFFFLVAFLFYFFFTFFEEKTIPLFYRIWLEAVNINIFIVSKFWIFFAAWQGHTKLKKKKRHVLGPCCATTRASA